MKQSKMYIPMVKDVSSQAVCQSHILSIKAGLIHQTAAGIYSYLPLANTMIKKIKEIICEEIDAIGGNEVILPLLQPSDLWEKSGRWQGYGNELFRVNDRKNGEFALAPTHEEVVTDLVKNFLVSYKKYPVNLYQIAVKMRDEARPRFGLLRGREFIMMDGYSFHTSIESLQETYDQYYQAYCNIFDRIGLNYRIVEADNGKIGGSSSHEFMALADIGEDTIVYVEGEPKAFNLEVAPIYYNGSSTLEAQQTIQELITPGCKTIDSLVKEYDLPINKLVKSIALDVDGELVIALIRGDRTLNEIKIGKVLNAKEDVKIANYELIQKNNLIEGFIGPVNLKNIKIIADNEIQGISNIIVGANKVDTHFINVDINKDVKDVTYFDIREIEEGDYFSEKLGPVKFARGIEIGHIFALGNSYSKSLNVEYLNAQQKLETPEMGCYGIGVTRLISAIIEQQHDEKGIIMPKSITPYDIHIVPLDYGKDELQTDYVDKLEKELNAIGLKVLIDDRDERPGVKFGESDVLGLPIRIVVGRKLKEGSVELKERTKKESVDLNVENVLNYIKDIYL